MFSYLQQFERDFAKSAARIIDATEGGAVKAGAEIMTLCEAAEQYCRRPVPAECFDYLKTTWYDTAKLDPARKMLVDRLDELGAFRKLCQETKEVLAELETLLDSPTQFNRRIARVDELRTLVQEHEVLFRMTRDVSQIGELQKFAADRQIAGDQISGTARATRQLQRDRQFIESMLEGCDNLERILTESRDRFDEAIEETSKRQDVEMPKRRDV